MLANSARRASTQTEIRLDALATRPHGPSIPRPARALQILRDVDMAASPHAAIGGGRENCIGRDRPVHADRNLHAIANRSQPNVHAQCTRTPSAIEDACCRAS